MLYSDEYIRQRWRELANPVERSAFAAKVADNWHNHINNTVEEEHPDWSAGDITAEAFIRKYGDEFIPERLQSIVQWIRDKYNK